VGRLLAKYDEINHGRYLCSSNVNQKRKRRL